MRDFVANVPFMIVWIQFIVCMVLICLAGVRLIRYGDALADLTGLSRSWIGLILVATVTSLPELVTGLSAVTVTRAPDIAVGDALGSCVFNLAILAFVDVFYRKAPIYSVSSPVHVLPAGLGAMLLALTALIALLSKQGHVPQFGHVSVGSVMLIGLYFVSMRVIYSAQQKTSEDGAHSLPEMGMQEAVTGYAVASVLIVVCGVWLPFIGVELATIMGWSNSFVGTLFIAFATSVPELATTIAALRMGSVDLAIGNLLGSNLFDVLILALDDLAYQAGPLYERVSGVHASTAVIAALMSGCVVVAWRRPPVSRVFCIGSWTSMALIALYLVNAMVQFQYGH